jgi:hypothetical protein
MPLRGLRRRLTIASSNLHKAVHCGKRLAAPHVEQERHTHACMVKWDGHEEDEEKSETIEQTKQTHLCGVRIAHAARALVWIE